MSCRRLRVSHSVVLCVAASAAFASSAAAFGLTEEPVDEAKVQAEADFRAAVRATNAGNNTLALSLFERALPHKRDTSDIFYNLVQVAKLEKATDKVALYGQSFLLIEPDTKDADQIRRMVEAAWKTQSARGREPVVITLRLPEGAKAYVDEAPVADHTLPTFKLPPGKYSLRVDKPDHVALAEELVVVAGAPVDRTVALERIVYRAKVKVLTDPAAGVVVLADGQRMGETPLAEPLDLEAKKKILLRFEKPGYDPWVRYIELGKDEVLELTPRLEKTRPPTP